MNPEEASKGADILGAGEWMRQADAKDLLLCIHHCVKNQSSTRQLEMAKAALSVRLATDAETTANKVVKLTSKLVWLTWGLFGLTIVLGLVAAAQLAIMFVEHFAKTP